MKRAIFAALLLLTGCGNVPTSNNELVSYNDEPLFTTGTYKATMHREVSDDTGWAAVEDYEAEVRIRQRGSVLNIANCELDIIEGGDITFTGMEKSTNSYTGTVEQVIESGGVVSWLPFTLQLNFDGIINDHDNNPVYLYWDKYTVTIGEKLYDGY